MEDDDDDEEVRYEGAMLTLADSVHAGLLQTGTSKDKLQAYHSEAKGSQGFVTPTTISSKKKEMLLGSMRETGRPRPHFP